MTEDEMVGWHHQLNGHGFEWTLGIGDGQGGLACCSSWGNRESDTTEQRLNRTELNLLNLQSLTQFEKFSIIISSHILSASICLFYFFFSDSIDMKIICFDYCPTGF